MDNNDIANEKRSSAANKAYKEWDTQDVSSWLKDHLKLPQYCETFCKYIINYKSKSNFLACIFRGDRRRWSNY